MAMTPLDLAALASPHQPASFTFQNCNVTIHVYSGLGRERERRGRERSRSRRRHSDTDDDDAAFDRIHPRPRSPDKEDDNDANREGDGSASPAGSKGHNIIMSAREAMRISREAMAIRAKERPFSEPIQVSTKTHPVYFKDDVFH